MNFEVNRLNTFTDWPISAPVDPVRLSKAGFYYIGEGLEVKCFSCEVRISQWNYGDQVMWRHRQLKPNCAFVVNPHLSGNVPLVLGTTCTPTEETAIYNEGQTDTIETAQDYGVTETDEMYKCGALRLLSFIRWEDGSVPPETLVSVGFYQTNEGRLRCAYCGGELPATTRFSLLGQPLQVHRMYFPQCAYAEALEYAQLNSLLLPSSPPSDTSPLRSPDTSDDPSQSSGAIHNAALLRAGRRLRSLGVVGGGAKHPQYAAIQTRLATFRRWPADRTQTPRALAEAGFYHTGVDDQVRCYFCDGGLGKWEAGDAPWAEHARWFPHCGLLLLTKGQEFVDSCRLPSAGSTNRGLTTRRRTPSEMAHALEQLEECMESGVALAALNAGLDAARVRRAIARRLRTTGVPFTSSEALIDAVLDEQLNEESWSVTPTLRLPWDDERPTSPRSPSPINNNIRDDVQIRQQTDSSSAVVQDAGGNDEQEVTKDDLAPEMKQISLEEENRQLKEARLCKVCMDSEVSVVFLPCGHLVSCARCGAALAACPMCRAPVKALVRAYLA